jgi:hypothetical protein
MREPYRVVEAEYRFAVDRALSLFVAALRIALTRKGGHNPYYRAGMEGDERVSCGRNVGYLSLRNGGPGVEKRL